MLWQAFTAATLVGCAIACGDDINHNHAKRASSTPSVITPPTRPLEWGDLNILHTTDTHGWLLGHQKSTSPEPNYSGDFGDFSSFVSHMKEIARRKKVDFLLVDSGDLHDGTGLTDGFPTGGVDAHDANMFVTKLPYDVMAIGNHELYIYNNTLDMHQNFAPKLHGRYLSSNANITINNVSVPVGGNRFAKFKTAQGKRVTALGVLFNFLGFDKGLNVQKVADMVKEPWFLSAIAECPDLFLLAGHMPVQRDNWPLVFNAIRTLHPTVPIVILGGHTHIRDCIQLDALSMSLESGRYMETLGFMSIKFSDASAGGNVTFKRRYLDPNRVTYEFHSGKKRFFDTIEGLSIKAGLKRLAKRFDLTFLYGTAPTDYRLSAAPYPGANSLLTLVGEKVLPVALSVNNTRAASGIPAFFITNSGSLRFDIYSGTFTKNDQFTASPFADAFLYVPGVPAGIAKQLFATLNAGGSNNKREQEEAELYARGWVGTRYNAWLEEMDRRALGTERRAAANATLGYVTSDSCPGVGDDTMHAPLPFYSSPAFISSAIPAVSDSDPIDLVFVDFIQTQLISTLNRLQSTKTYSAADVTVYSPLLANAILGVYAQKAWN